MPRRDLPQEYEELIQNRPHKQMLREIIFRYTGTEEFGEYILLTNFDDYVENFGKKFGVKVYQGDRMRVATHDNISIINFGMGGSCADAAMMSLAQLAKKPKACLLLGKCGSMKRRKRTNPKIGDYILPNTAIKDDGISHIYLRKDEPAMPNLVLHQAASQILSENEKRVFTGTIYTTSIRTWEHLTDYVRHILMYRPLAIEMESAALFAIGYIEKIPTGAILLVSDEPLYRDGIKTRKSDKLVTQDHAEKHLDYGIQTLQLLKDAKRAIKHFVPHKTF